MSHTPGPWKAEFMDGIFQNAYDGEGAEVDAGARGVIAANGSMVAYTSRGWANLQEARANIRLIAAAPELLELLKQFVSDIEERDPIYPSWIDAARAAIAKAES